MIRVLVTGGTFDKEYDEINGRLYFKQTHLPELFNFGRCALDISIRTLMMIDSLEMTEEDREIIIRACKRCKEEQVVITHGTDTMVKTAQILESHKINKTIVLTGAMIPIKFGSSDGFFNLGSALAFAQTLPHGVYIAMNGKYFNANNVIKNKKTGFFEERNG
jgi:L-asparaginase